MNISARPDPPKLEVRDNQGRVIKDLLIRVIPGVPTVVTVAGRDVDKHEIEVAVVSLPKNVAIKASTSSINNTASTTIQSDNSVLASSTDGFFATTLTLEALACASTKESQGTIGFQLTDLTNNVVDVSGTYLPQYFFHIYLSLYLFLLINY